YVPLSNFTGSGLDGIPDVVLAQMLNPSHHYGMQYNGRVDYQRGNHVFAASTYITTVENLTVPNLQFRPMSNILNKPLDPAGTLLWNWTISPTVLNQARVNFSRYNFDEVSTNPRVSFGIPESQIEGIFNTGPRLDFGVPRGNNTPGVLSQNTYAFRDTFSKILGKHALKFGGEIRKEQNNNNEIGLARPVYSSVRLNTPVVPVRSRCYCSVLCGFLRRTLMRVCRGFCWMCPGRHTYSGSEHRAYCFHAAPRNPAEGQC